MGLALQIDYLANHPHFIDALAPALVVHWQPVTGQESIEARVAKFQAHLNYDSLPVAWVAFSGSTVFGTSALRIADLPGYEHLTPWLGGVFVLPEHRGRGIGARLCAEVERCAAHDFGVSTLYLFTLDRQAWYQKQSWRVLEPCSWSGYAGDVMSKVL